MTDRPNVFADRENRICVYAPRGGAAAIPYVLGEFNEHGDFITHQRVGEIPPGYYWAGTGAEDAGIERRHIANRMRRDNDDQSFDELLAGIRTLADVIASMSARHAEVCEERDQQRARADAAEADLDAMRRT
ncbi:hypothetical protein SEA_GALADRIEL_65 [Gordonia phage Galadriel]|uniref:Uncharacterized protein n=2 Tax=Vividuovirus TaxID=2560251 RepID=A0A7G8LDZ9_9CAUD|nr:hypothetical protein KNU61_gp65 [Gordonia phage Galadriel]YP_010109522.1 hypothetical protein KNV17_gp68 [Gordonia phage Paries]QDH92084.1 hypothetical protein SEA_GALADRIEL_65 [Gordonia phage Galadriel]QNJ55471.1 hypothetical protein SEA_PARIES_68 [Gordonia phage Paries]